MIIPWSNIKIAESDIKCKTKMTESVVKRKSKMAKIVVKRKNQYLLLLCWIKGLSTGSKIKIISTCKKKTKKKKKKRKEVNKPQCTNDTTV